MKIITISQQYGSGGGELSKRLADILQFDCYDKEIITAIAKNRTVDETYIKMGLDSYFVQPVVFTYRRYFGGATLQSYKTELLLEQKHVIEEIAKAGRNCVIVGHNADVILREYNPLSIFVCADLETKIRRCMEHASEGENLSRRKIVSNIRNTDKSQARIREIMTSAKWGDPSTYDLTVNATAWDINELAVALSHFVESWFDKKNE